MLYPLTQHLPASQAISDCEAEDVSFNSGGRDEDRTKCGVIAAMTCFL